MRGQASQGGAALPGSSYCRRFTASSFPGAWASPFCPVGLQACLEAEPDLRQMTQKQGPVYRTLSTGPFPLRVRLGCSL